MIKKLTKKKALMIILLTVFLLTLSTIGAVNATSYTKDVKDTTLTKNEVKTVNNVKTDLKINKETKKVNTKKINTTKARNKNTNTTSVTKNNNHKNVKTAEPEIVTDYAGLSSLLTSTTNEELTVNLDGAETYESEGIITVNKNIRTLTINGNSRTIDGKTTNGFLDISMSSLSNAKINLVIKNLTVKNCKNSYGGAILFNNAQSTTTSNITIINSTFSDNCANATSGIIRGGAIYQKTGNMTLIDSNFSNNKVALYSATYGSYLWHIGWGGAVAQETHSILTIDNCNFTSNMAGGRGGAICQYTDATTVDFQLYINNSKFTENKVISNMSNHENQGGAIFQYGGIIKINDTIFNENSAGLYGGAIYQDNYKSVSSLELNRCNFTKNNILIQGGAIYAKSDINITKSNFTENYAVNFAELNYANPDVYGGAICQSVSNAVLNINNSSFTSNHVKSNYKGHDGGGAIYQSSNGVMNINDSNFTSNSAVNNHASGNKYSYGAAIYQGTGKLLVNNSHFTSNLLQSLRSNYCYGGAIYAKSISLNYSNLTSNKVDSGSYARGGALWVDNINCNYCNFTNNTAKDGGVIYLDDQSQIMSYIANNTFKDNWVSDNSKYVLYWSMPYYIKIINNTFINNTNNERDMLFGLTIPNEVHDNVYIDNFISDSMDSVGDEEITQDFEKEINFYLKPYLGSYNSYNDTVRNGTVTLYINDQVIGNPSPVDNGKTTIKVKLSDLPEKENLITLKYVSDSKHYQNMTKTFTLIKSLIDTNITVSANDSVKVGKIVTINGTLTKDDEEKTPIGEATVNLYINDTLVNTTQTNSTGGYVFYYTTTVVGIQNISVNYTGEGIIQASSNKTTVNVLARETNVTIVNNQTVTVGDYLTISGVLYDELGENVTNTFVNISVGENLIENVAVDGDGRYSTKYLADSVGNFTITVSYNNDTTSYISSTNTSNVLVKQKNTKITVKATSVKVGSNTVVSGKLVDGDNKGISGVKVTVLLNGNDEYIVTTESDGTYSKEIMTSVVGVNNVTVTYSGNESHNSSTNNTTFNVEKVDSKIILDSIDDTKMGEDVTVKGILLGVDGKVISDETVTIKVNNKEYNVTTDSDGTFSKTILSNVVGKNNVTVTFSGNGNYSSASNKTTYNVEKVATKLTVNKINDTTIGSKAKVTGKLLDENAKALSNATIKVGVDGKTYTTKTDKDGLFTVTALTNTTGKLKVKVEYSGSDKYSSASATSSVTVSKVDVIVKVKSVTGVIGENMTFTATVTDKKGNNISGGSLIFKLNGVSFNKNKRFDNSCSTPYKFTVKNGKVSFKIIADYYLKNGGNITATYSGTDTYKKVNSKVAKLTVKLRNMKIAVKAKPSRVKQYKNVTFTATVTDTTKNAKNKTALLENSYVIFKIDGKTIKVKGKTANVTVKSNKVTYKYTIPKATAGIYVNKKIRYYNVTAKYGSKLFYTDNNSANANYTVARSKITIKVNKAIIKNKKLSIKGSIKDYMKKYVKGTNKVCVKIDGLSYEVNGKVQYFKIKNGRINLKNIKIKNPSKVKKLVIVSGERVAYIKGQSKATKIVKQKNVKQ